MKRNNIHFFGLQQPFIVSLLLSVSYSTQSHREGAFPPENFSLTLEVQTQAETSRF